MKSRFIPALRFSVFVLFLLSGVAWFALQKEREGMLTIAFIDVGQGDAIFIEAPSGNQMIIDGGPNREVLRKLGKEMPFYDRSIDVLISTHPDKDHIGGLLDVLRRFKVSLVVEPGARSDTTLDEVFDEAKAEEKANVLLARRGMVIDLGGGASFEVLFPDRDVLEFETNDASIVGKLTYGSTSFLLTGDSPLKIEEHLVSLDKAGLEASVLKAGHHGSRTSTGDIFLDSVKPRYAIISAGKDNSYGHPHEEVTERLQKRGIEMLSTIDSGTVRFKSDGKILFVEKAK